MSLILLVKRIKNQDPLLLTDFLTPGRQNSDGRGDWGELRHPQGGAQEEGAVHALAHQVHIRILLEIKISVKL